MRKYYKKCKRKVKNLPSISTIKRQKIAFQYHSSHVNDTQKHDHILQLKSNGSMHFHNNDNFVCYSDIDLTHDQNKKTRLLYLYTSMQLYKLP